MTTNGFLKISPEEFENAFNEALEHRNKGNHEKALAGLLELEKTGMRRAAIIGMIGGILYYDIDDLSRAMPYLKGSVILSPKSKMASMTLFHALIDCEDVDGAIEEAERFLSLNDSEEYREILNKTQKAMKEK